MSSAGATRTSIGKLIRQSRRANSARTSASTAARCSRGMAYSCSLNRTRRGLVNTRCEVSVYCRAPSARVAMPLMAGMLPG